MKRIIGITGAAGAGKDTLADYLVEQHGFVKVSFAAALKDGLCAIFGWDKSLLNDREWKERVLPDIGKSPRQLMQTIGTEWGRECVHKDLWLILARTRIASSAQSVVLSDVRFDNEAQLIRELGGSVWHLKRSGISSVAAHSSETPVGETEEDIVVNNNGSVAELFALVDTQMALKQVGLRDSVRATTFGA